MKLNKKIVFFSSIILVIAVTFFIRAVVSLADSQSIINKRLSNGIVFYVGSPISYVNNVKTSIDEKDQEIYPIIKNNRVMIPVRFLAEKLGAKVDWDDRTRTATLVLNGKTVKLTLGNKKMKVNNSEVVLDVTPLIRNERMFVPVRAISEAFDKKVFWDRGLVIISDKENIFDVDKEKEMIDEVISRVNVLPTVNSYENLKKLLEKSQKYSKYFGKDLRFTVYDDVAMSSAQRAMKSEEPLQNASSSDYSKTNVQVEGVDEADIVKTDGEHIYQINNRKVVIIKAYPPSEMSVVNTLNFEKEDFYPRELYVDSKRLIVIGTTSRRIPMDKANSEESKVIVPYIYYPQDTTKAIIYNITDKQNIKQIREIELDGYYVSSRKIDSDLYMITNKYINYYYIQEKDKITPCYRDTNIKEDYINIDFRKIQYLPNFVEPNYLIIGGVNLDSSEPVNISTYLGTGNNVYASRENLYVTTYTYNSVVYKTSILPMPDLMPPYNEPNTFVYKFSLNNGVVNYSGKGEVPGRILNQFSMDEHNGYFRIATTTGETWKEEFTSKNNVYILDKNLYIVGRLENIAPGERIYSVRFMGDRGYMVTFKTVDPFFVIDLKEPTSPKILGYLKIPGYSDYLHPYDENHIIGFGRDTIEIPVKDEHGRSIGTRVVNGGMKLAIIDVSDVSNPVQKFVEKIGDMGTYSDLLHDHKALLFSKDKNLLAFPIEFRENRMVPTFQGAYVYSIDLNNGFVLKGKIKHYTDNEISERYNYYYDYNKRIERVLYIGDTLYTLSKSMIKANNLNTIAEIKSIEIQ